MNERETKRQRQERIRSERQAQVQHARGRQRWPKWAIVTGTALLLTVGIVGGTVYHYIDQGNPYSISANEGVPLVQQALTQEGVSFDSQEKDLWEKAEIRKKDLPTDTIANIVDTRLNLLRETMHASKVSDFKSTAERFDELISKDILHPRILTNAPFHSTKATTGVEITEGKITLELSISVADIQQQPLWATAIDFVHERKHIEDFLAFDSKNEGLTDDQRRAALKDLMGTTRKNLDVEAPAYAEQIKAFLRFSALTGLNTSDTLFLPMTAQYVRVNKDYHHPKFEAYLVTRHLVD